MLTEHDVDPTEAHSKSQALKPRSRYDDFKAASANRLRVVRTVALMMFSGIFFAEEPHEGYLPTSQSASS